MLNDPTKAEIERLGEYTPLGTKEMMHQMGMENPVSKEFDEGLYYCSRTESGMPHCTKERYDQCPECMTKVAKPHVVNEEAEEKKNEGIKVYEIAELWRNFKDQPFSTPAINFLEHLIERGYKLIQPSPSEVKGTTPQADNSELSEEAIDDIKMEIAKLVSVHKSNVFGAAIEIYNNVIQPIVEENKELREKERSCVLCSGVVPNTPNEPITQESIREDIETYVYSSDDSSVFGTEMAAHSVWHKLAFIFNEITDLKKQLEEKQKEIDRLITF